MSDSSSLHWFGLTDNQLSKRLRSIAGDVDKGVPPAHSYVVEVNKWALARRTVPCLIGIPNGHPTVEDGKPLFTSELFYLDTDEGFARSFSRWYRLGDRVEPEYWNTRFPVKS